MQGLYNPDFEDEKMFQGFRDATVRSMRTFCDEHNLSERDFGLLFAHDHKLVDRIEGGLSIGLSRLEEIETRAAAWAAGEQIPTGGVKGFGLRKAA